MKTLIKDILNALGFGIYGLMPACTDSWCESLKSFAPSFQVACIKDKEDEKVFALTASADEVVQIKYTLNGKHIVGVEVSEI